MQKAYLLMKQNSTESRMISKYLHGTILRNQLKCRLFSPTEIRQAPDAVRAVTPSSDQYLVDLYFTASASKLITTDTVLLEKLPVTKNVEVEHRDSFIKDYPNGPTTQVCP